MKRVGNLYTEIISIDNLRLADARARKGKGNQYGVKVFDRNPEGNILALHEALLNKSYQTSPYTTFNVYEPKERLVFRLPYFPDRITHHAVMNVLEPLFTSWFTADTYSCIKGKGIHAAKRSLERALRNAPGTHYCLKLDIRKFYPNIDHDILKALLRRKIKDNDLLWLLDEIIDSADGVPIGNYLSQYFANFYLTYFDHWVKEALGVRYYFRYADDLVFLASNKPELHRILDAVKRYLKTELNLEIKPNYQVFPVSARGIDFIGYRFYHTHTLMRKGIKKRFANAILKGKPLPTIAAYFGWATHCNSRHFIKKFSTHEQLQRLQNKTKTKQFHRRQDKTRPDIQYPDHSSRLQDRAVQKS